MNCTSIKLKKSVGEPTYHHSLHDLQQIRSLLPFISCCSWYQFLSQLASQSRCTHAPCPCSTGSVALFHNTFDIASTRNSIDRKLRSGKLGLMELAVFKLLRHFPAPSIFHSIWIGRGYIMNLLHLNLSLPLHTFLLSENRCSVSKTVIPAEVQISIRHGFMNNLLLIVELFINLWNCPSLTSLTFWCH